jgi:hypothetical protein
MMIDRILTVGGLTLASRVTGFLRDIVMAAVLGAGPVADAFLVAFRLPNHFRAIFAEGAFAAAFVPAYARIRTRGGADAARLFGGRIFTLLLISQLVLLAVALLFTPAVIELLAPGFHNDPTRFPLAVTLTRITFPYLLLMTLVTLFSGILNSLERFAAAAAAPILLNLTMMATLLTAWFFPTPGHAAAWGVLIAGVLELITMLAYGALTDRVGRRPVYLFGAIFSLLFAFPFFWMVDTRDAFLIGLAIVVGLNLGHAAMYATQASFFSELFGTRVRYSGASLGYQLSSVFAGGLSPIIATAMLAQFGTYVPVAVYLVFMAVVTVIAVWAASETRRQDIHEEDVLPPTPGEAALSTAPTRS